MITVKKINWLDEDAKEAEVTLTDGKYSVLCFSHPCMLKINDGYDEVLYGFNPINIFKLSEKEYSIEEEEPDRFKLKGELIDSADSIIQIGNFKIDISAGDIAGDIYNRDFVELTVSRIDTV
ncbi:hypothetical protein HCJ05_09965 [Listeria seeligeri]|uniref:hypothetical protein n=1 Tax=Listeria seeligeri TaxID=1640 RepID=UPI001626424A|nr:hypothetical protein [Listeria seeligeri]MBC1527829.1 hypothetical protein [Listeria seeligeri]MBC1942275.1 hypothetical protein [Listeria seeligeri]